MNISDSRLIDPTGNEILFARAELESVIRHWFAVGTMHHGAENKLFHAVDIIVCREVDTGKCIRTVMAAKTIINNRVVATT